MIRNSDEKYGTDSSKPDHDDSKGCCCCKKKTPVIMPPPPSNPFSQAVFWPVAELVSQGNDHPLTKEELFGSSKLLTSDYAYQKFRPPMMKFAKKRSPPGKVVITKKVIAYAIFRFCWGRWLLSLVLSLIAHVLLLVVPYLIEDLVAYFEDPESEVLTGVGYAALIVAASLIAAVCRHYGEYIMKIVSVGIRHALQRLIYDKTLCMRLADIPNPGRCVNLLSTDTQTFMDSLGDISTTITAPVYLAIAALLLYRTIKWVGIAGFFISLLTLPLSLIIMRIISYNTRKYKARTDKRLRFTDELIHGIRIIKYYVWERPFLQRIDEARDDELNALFGNGMLRTTNTTITHNAASAATFLTFLIQVLIGEPVTPGNVFTTFATFKALRDPLSHFGKLFNKYAQWNICLSRICDFLNLPEISSSSNPLGVLNEKTDKKEEGVELDSIRPRPEKAKRTKKKSKDSAHDKKYCVEIHNGNYVWSDGKPALTNIDLTVGEDELVMIIGSVGSGKSALVYAILNELNKAPDCGTVVCCSDSVSYVPQTPWILNKTIRDNILFGKQYDAELYKRVVQACCLEDDIRIFPGNDKCEIGERGITLSGGQKQRISLARACYANNSLFVLDDPLSALDMHVGAAVMENCINGLMKHRARVLVTHHLNYLSQADKIVVMDNQRIAFTGTFEELKKSSIDFSSFLTIPPSEAEEKKKHKGHRHHHGHHGHHGHHHRHGEHSRHGREDELGKLGGRGMKLGGIVRESAKSFRIMQKETVQKGTISKDVIKQYLKAGGFLMLFFILFGYINKLVSSIGYSIVLSQWSTASENASCSYSLGSFSGSESSLSSSSCAGNADDYILIQGVFLLYDIVSFVLTAFLWIAFCRRASRTIHRKFINSLAFAATTFFDTTPLGRLISRFSVDFHQMDFTLPQCFQFACQQIVSLISLVVIVSLGDWWMCLLFIPLVIFYYWRQKRYRKALIQIRRIEGLSRSPIYVNFDSTLSGLACIRAYRCVPRFCDEFRDTIDENARVYQSLFMTVQWFSQRLDWLGGVVQGVVVMSLILSKYTNNLDIGFTALALANMSSITETLGGLSKRIAETEQSLQSVERIEEYCYLEPEGHPDDDEVEDKLWPNKGKIVFENVSARYRRELPLVVRNVSFAIEPKKKIGVVGRTGSGKSTILQLLYRMVELEEGKIYIDGVNIGEITLDCLRSKLSIIPQEPTLFHGSVRYNLDPLEQSSDEEIWQCLELTHLRPVIEAMGNGLESTIADHGENMSVGQRQLMCIARAILRKSRILVMDEATASVDLQTDQLIQSMIQRQFSDCTVITIAHRLHTVLNYDEILVLDDGHVVEHGPPAVLLGANGEFAALVASSHDDVLVDQISQMASSHAASESTVGQLPTSAPDF